MATQKKIIEQIKAYMPTELIVKAEDFLSHDSNNNLIIVGDKVDTLVKMSVQKGFDLFKLKNPNVNIDNEDYNLYFTFLMEKRVLVS